MTEEKFDELAQRASQIEETDAIRQLEAKARVLREIQAMKDEGKALELTDEEEKMLHSFRRFRSCMRKTCETFTWQTRRAEGVQPVTETDGPERASDGRR